MPISADQISDFIERYERAFGERLQRDEAEIMAGRLLYLYRRMRATMPPSLPSPAAEQTSPEAS